MDKVPTVEELGLPPTDPLVPGVYRNVFKGGVILCFSRIHSQGLLCCRHIGCILARHLTKCSDSSLYVAAVIENHAMAAGDVVDAGAGAGAVEDDGDEGQPGDSRLTIDVEELKAQVRNSLVVAFTPY